MLLSVCLALLILGVNSTASGYDSWTCHPSQHNTPYTVSGATGPFFGIRLLGPNSTVVNTYTPGVQQTVELYSKVTGALIAGVTAAAFTGNSTVCPTSCSTANSAGALAPAPSVSYLRSMSRCSGGVTQTSIQRSTSFKFTWTAPSNQSGPVTIWTIVVGAGDTYEAVSASFTGLYLAPVSPISVSSVSTTPTVSVSSTLSIVILSQTHLPTPFPNSTARISTPTSMTTIGTATSTHTPTPSPSLALTQTLTPTLTQTLTPTLTQTLTPTPSHINILSNAAPPPETEKTWNSLSIAAVLIASLCGCIGVVYIGANVYRQKTRNRAKETIVMMPRAVYEV